MLNKVMLMGRLTNDPEMRFSTAGVAVVRFTLAVQRSYVKQGEERQTDFINIVAFRSTAEFIGKWFKKGQLMVVVGSLQSKRWEDKDGKTQFGMDIVAEEVYFGESKKDRDSAPSPVAQPAQSAPAPSEPDKTVDFDDNFMPIDDAELPF